MSTEDRPHRVGLVLAGGGARGAYEMGVLSVLLPFLESRGERPSIFVGTSVGAINAAAMASTAHLPAEEAVEVGMARWREVEPRSVLRSLVGSQVALVALRYAGEIARVPGVRLQSLLDPAPLHDNLERWVDWAAMRANLDGDQLCLGVVTTAARSGRSVVFVDGCLHEERHRSHLMDYVPAEIGPLHIQASAAIPLLFPSVRIEEPESARGWYVDGGTRLNTPIKPALDLGADRLIVIGTDAVTGRPSGPEPEGDGQAPDIGDTALHMLHGALVDPLGEDVRRLGAINMFFADPEANGAVRYRAVRGKPAYRPIPYVFVSPATHDAVGRLAQEVYDARYRGARALRSPDLALLNRLLGGPSPTHGALLSYLLFDPEFIDGLLQLGASDARRWLETDPGPEEPWQLEPLDVFTGARVP